MKIGIDITPALKDKAGIGYVTYSMIEALAQIDQANEYELLTNTSEVNLEFELPPNFKITSIPASKAGFRWMIKGSKYLRDNGFDRFVSTSNFLWSIIFNNTIQIVHDLAPLKYPQYFTRKGSLFYSLQLRVALHTARFVVTISKTVLSELLQINTKSNKDYILLGLHSWAIEKKFSNYYKEIIDRYSLPEKYFVMVGTLEPRKNHVSAIKAFSLFVKDYPDFKLVIVGKKGWFYEKIFETVKELGLEERVIFTGYAPEEDLVGLIDLSQGGLQLSFYEGFGLPIIEFSARGKRVLASDIPVFQEVAEEIPSVIYTQPTDIDSIKNGMVKLLKQDILSKPLDIEKYSWVSFAKKLLSVINQ